MIEFLRDIDHSLFHTINYQWANGFFDTVCPLLRADLFLAVCYIGLAGMVWAWYPKPGLFLRILLLAGIAFLLTDKLSAAVVKPWVHRIRPCNNLLMEARLIVAHCGSGFSFVSSHAANVSGLATFAVTLSRGKQWVFGILFIWAAAVSFSQVYVGVHFPADVLGGAILGITVGGVGGYLCQRFIIKPAQFQTKI